MKALTAKLASTRLKMKHRSDRINQSDPLRAQEKLFRKMKSSSRKTSIYHDLPPLSGKMSHELIT